MSREWRFYLDDIRKSAAKVVTYTAGLDRQAFLADERTFEEVIFNI